MRKITLFLLLILSVCVCAVSNSAVGFGASVTGGKGGSVVAVKSASELRNALKSSGSKIIVITQDITIDTYISVTVSNKTLLALPGKKLVSTSQDKSAAGILYLKGSNFIMRNITLVGPGAYDCDATCGDLLTLDGMYGVWVDHCDFQDGCDGNFDIKNNTDNMTVSYCRFRYLKAPRSGGSGGSDDHRFSNLVGSGSSNAPNDGRFSITYDHCWWDNGCVERMTRCRNADIHYLNCYWNSSVAKYYIGPENASSYCEGCTFKRLKASKIVSEQSGSTNQIKMLNCVSDNGLPSDKGSANVPSYSYSIQSPADAVAAITDATCGAGATLNVTAAGAVSSPCDTSTDPSDDPSDDPSTDPSDDPSTDPSEEPNPEIPDFVPNELVNISTFWNISDSDFPLGEINGKTTVRKLLMVGSSSKTMNIATTSQNVDGMAFTKTLKLGGAGNKSARYVAFRVASSCVIEVYAKSSGSDDRTLNLAVDGFNVIKSTLPANANGSHSTYTYSGEAANIYIYSAGSGINVFAIRVTYNNEGTALNNAEDDLIYDGSVIRNDSGKSVQVFNALGQQIMRTSASVIPLHNLSSGLYIIRSSGKSLKILR